MTTRVLPSSNAWLLVVPRTHTLLARRAFSVTAPTVWNSLQSLIRGDVNKAGSFKVKAKAKSLKAKAKARSLKAKTKAKARDQG